MIEPAHIPAVLSFAHTFGDFAKELARFRKALGLLPAACEVWVMGSCPWADGGEDVLADLASWVEVVAEADPVQRPLPSPA